MCGTRTCELFLSGSVLFGALVGVASGTAGWGPAALAPTPIAEEQVAIQEQEENIPQLARKTFMRGKLSSNQKIVEGLATRNFALIGEGAKEIQTLVKGQHWFVLQTKEYQDYSAEMQAAAGLLEQAAASQNLDSAALRYFDLTLNCLDCHRYIEKQKY